MRERANIERGRALSNVQQPEQLKLFSSNNDNPLKTQQPQVNKSYTSIIMANLQP